MAPSRAKDYPAEYILASAMAAAINYPLWRASALAQSGFRVASSSFPPSLSPYVYAFAPPYKGMVATVFGMTWARAAIFWGSDRGKELLSSSKYNVPTLVATIIPPLVVSTGVQCINMPIVRAAITLQDPQSNLSSVWSALKHIYKQGGVSSLWHGTSAGILKTVPKYCTAVLVKDWMENVLPAVDPSSPTVDSDRLWRSATKSACAGVAGAALTNRKLVIIFDSNRTFLMVLVLLLSHFCQLDSCLFNLYSNWFPSLPILPIVSGLFAIEWHELVFNMFARYFYLIYIPIGDNLLHLSTGCHSQWNVQNEPTSFWYCEKFVENRR